MYLVQLAIAKEKVKGKERDRWSLEQASPRIETASRQK